jgi:hypothetical protein
MSATTVLQATGLTFGRELAPGAIAVEKRDIFGKTDDCGGIGVGSSALSPNGCRIAKPKAIECRQNRPLVLDAAAIRIEIVDSK